ncbi:MgtC/SapB family protein, partial [Desulfocurvibacter africanus]
MSAQTISDFIQSHAILGYLAKLAMSYLLAFPIAWERERDARSAGLRTFPLVAVASCGYMLTGISALAGADAQSRVFYGIITGIGFIGGGAILKHSGSVRGTA